MNTTQAGKNNRADARGEIVESIRKTLEDIGFCDSPVTDEVILNVISSTYRKSMLSYMKQQVMTHDGVIAKQIMEHIQFEYFAGNPGKPVKIKTALAVYQGDMIKSRIDVKRRMLNDLVARGFLERQGRFVTPVTPCPSWDCYTKEAKL